MSTPIPHIRPLEPMTPFMLDGAPLSITVSDFWRYALSDLVTNMNRGAVAEFIVETALAGSDKRKELINDFQPFDIMHRGMKIEVKSSAYIQGYPGCKATLSTPRFSIRKKLFWNQNTNKLEGPPARHWNILVCALLSEKTKRPEPLDLGQWEFYVLSEKRLEANPTLAKGSSLTVKHLSALGISPCRYGELCKTVDALVT